MSKMNRDKWRELCARTPKGNCGTPRMFHQSTFYEWVFPEWAGLDPKGPPVFRKACKGSTFRKG